MASFSFFFFVCSLLESVLQRGVGGRAGGTCLFALSWSQLAGWRILLRLAGSELCWAWGPFRGGVAGGDTTPGEPVAGWRLRDCWGEWIAEGPNSLVSRMLKRRTSCKDLEGTAKSLLRFKHSEEASGLGARLEKRVCLQGHSGTGEVWFTNPSNFLFSSKSALIKPTLWWYKILRG